MASFRRRVCAIRTIMPLMLFYCSVSSCYCLVLYAGCGCLFMSVFHAAGLRTKHKGNTLAPPEHRKDISAALVMFALSQGFEFARLMPSDLLSPGSCRRLSVVGTDKYANAVEKAQLRTGFSRDGCHTCGMLSSATDSWLFHIACCYRRNVASPLGIISQRHRKLTKQFSGYRLEGRFCPSFPCSSVPNQTTLMDGHLQVEARGKCMQITSLL